MIPAWPPQATECRAAECPLWVLHSPARTTGSSFIHQGGGCGTQKLGCQHFPQRELEEPGSGEPLSTSCPQYKAEPRSRDTPSSQSTASLSQGQMLSSEVLRRLGARKCSCPDRSPPPRYPGPSVVLASPWRLCWACGLGCELPGLPPPASVSGA